MEGIGSLSKLGALAAVAVTAALIAGCGSSNSSTASKAAKGSIGKSTFAQAADASASAAGEKISFSMSSSGSSSDAFSMTGSGAFNRSPTAGAMTMSMDTSGENLQGIQFVINNGTMYMKFPSSLSSELSSVTGGKTWMQINIAQLGSAENVPELSELLNGNEVNPTSELKILADSSSNGLTKVGTATINGVATTEYKATLDLAKEASAVPSAERTAIKQLLAKESKSLGSTDIPVDVWIDGNNLVRQMTMSMSISADSVTIPMSFKLDVLNYGKQTVPSAPPASETYNMTNLLKTEAQSGALSAG